MTLTTIIFLTFSRLLLILLPSLFPLFFPSLCSGTNDFETVTTDVTELEREREEKLIELSNVSNELERLREHAAELESNVELLSQTNDSLRLDVEQSREDATSLQRGESVLICFPFYISTPRHVFFSFEEERKDVGMRSNLNSRRAVSNLPPLASSER